jgi:hypothetical protein
VVFSVLVYTTSAFIRLGARVRAKVKNSVRKGCSRINRQQF